VARPKEFDPDAAVARAMELFWRRGFGATTPADLVDELGIGKGSLYNAFESKRGLFEQALRRYGNERVAALTELLERPGPIRARLQAALERLASPSNAELRRRGCLAVNTVTELGELDRSATEIARDVFERMELAFRKTIELGQRTGEIGRDRDAKGIASLLVTTMLGMTVLGRADDRSARLQRVVRAAMTLV
jgi:TetR/AcrR family transcriptional repressor of nem operon